MSVPEQTPYKEYTGNGVTNNFALEFTCDSKQELKVFIDNVEPELNTWSLVGGSVVFTTAPVSGSKIVLKRATKLERTTNYSSIDNSFRPDAINKDLDRIWYAIQEQNFKAGQYDYDYNFVLSQVRPITTGGTGADNPNDARNNLNIYSKEEVNALIATGGEGNVVGIAGGGTGGITAAEARTNLGVPSTVEVAEAINSATPPDATTTVKGVAKIATTAIAQAGTNDTDFITAKKLRDAFNASGNAPVSACRAWLNMNGQSGVTIRASVNIASVVREQAGVYLVKTSVAMPIVNFAVLVGGSCTNAVSGAGTNGNINIINVSADSFRVFYSDGGLTDLYNLTLGVFC